MKASHTYFLLFVLVCLAFYLPVFFQSLQQGTLLFPYWHLFNTLKDLFSRSANEATSLPNAVSDSTSMTTMASKGAGKLPNGEKGIGGDLLTGGELPMAMTATVLRRMTRDVKNPLIVPEENRQEWGLQTYDERLKYARGIKTTEESQEELPLWNLHPGLIKQGGFERDFVADTTFIKESRLGQIDRSKLLVVSIVSSLEEAMSLNQVKIILSKSGRENLMVMCLDADICEKAKELNAFTEVVPTSWINLKPADSLFDSPEKAKIVRENMEQDDEEHQARFLWRAKLSVLRQLVHFKFKVYFQDTNVMWKIKRAWSEMLWRLTDKPKAVLCLSEGDMNMKNDREFAQTIKATAKEMGHEMITKQAMEHYLEPFTDLGIMVVLPDALTLQVLDLALLNLVARQHANAAGVFNEVLDVLGCKENGPNRDSMFWLDVWNYSNGHRYFVEKAHAKRNLDIFTVRVNHVDDQKSRIQALKEDGLWIL